MAAAARSRPGLSRGGLQGRLVRWHLAVLCGMTALLVGVQSWQLYGEARERLGERALTTSRLVARLPEVVGGAASGQPNPSLNARVNSLRGAAGPISSWWATVRASGWRTRCRSGWASRWRAGTMPNPSQATRS